VNTCEHNGTGFVNKYTARTGVIRKYKEISNWIPFAITQQSNYHEDTPLIAVSLVTAVMELTELIRNYWTYW